MATFQVEGGPREAGALHQEQLPLSGAFLQSAGCSEGAVDSCIRRGWVLDDHPGPFHPLDFVNHRYQRDSSEDSYAESGARRKRGHQHQSTNA